MGACSAEENGKKNKTPIKTVIDVGEGIEQKNGDNINLKSHANVNNLKMEYNINFKNLSSKIPDNSINKTIEGNSTLNQILTDMKLRQNADFEIDFNNNKNIGSDKINENFDDLMKEIFNKDIPQTIDMKYTYKGLDISENVIQAYRDTNTIIGYALMDNNDSFGLISYEVNTNLINSYNYNKEFHPEINFFCSFTAYCNAKNCLYLSGGEEEQNCDSDPNKTCIKFTNFFCVDLTQLDKEKFKIKELPNLKESRTWHSMIFVPDKYIFIVGGSNTKSVELYDIDKNEISEDSELNEIRSECTLCLVNNRYLYAFFGFLINQEYNKNIERCDLFKQKRVWEYVNYKEKENKDLIHSFFAISYLNDNELLLIGGNDNGNEKRFDYKYLINDNEEDDIIEEYNCDINENSVVFKEKLFIPIKDNKSIIIPLVIGDDIKIFFMENNGKINILNYQDKN